MRTVPVKVAMDSIVLEHRGHATALWLLGGLDPTGGAGLLRDGWTARACAPALPIARTVTAWTRQGSGRVATARARDEGSIVRELRAMPAPRAVKIGLLPAPLVVPVLREVAARRVPVVLDPVLLASDGGDLGGRAEVLRDALFDMSEETWMVTPNLGEAAALAGAGAGDPELLVTLAARLGRAAVLLKDGHGDDPLRVCDRLWLSGQVHVLARPRLAGADPRGTGCALATAIACARAQGRDPLAAVAAAVAWLDAARQRCVPGPDARPHLPRDAPPLA